eukprot:GHVU01208247.1.p1 GENE.GHVU01208247.1~~GHVU01208247.1.p1  ORF type:complete len:107 (+),score=0.40 GHVU01208247.1:285-605(+)
MNHIIRRLTCASHVHATAVAVVPHTCRHSGEIHAEENRLLEEPLAKVSSTTPLVHHRPHPTSQQSAVYISIAMLSQSVSQSPYGFARYLHAALHTTGLAAAGWMRT